MGTGWTIVLDVGKTLSKATVLKEFAALGPVDAIVPVAHGAAAALILEDRLECAPMDYERQGPDRKTYDEQRDPFACGALSLIQRKGPYTPLEPVAPPPIDVIRYREDWRERASHARGWS
jgi:hypothetical protein